MRNFCIFILLFSLSANAEYRVFRLLITPRNPTPQSPTENPTATDPATTPPPTQPPGRQVISTLDPDQYRGYFNVKSDEVITYTETWMCKGRTSDFKETCSPPERSPASSGAENPAPSTSSTPP